ncbi:hypothetical protein BDDG_12399 [Blastomyces dermatitidis ATCC 18188]|uniref:Uncharacterized protein n=1 Tax=Ajellomyces dermatitidis (strain ATCC 18188 / CBS 674.68) TaxID=653446 RepID=A0A0J9ENL6_AJEDA|nr:hypothetical protein BDDG_12399 [Blastomyces dermatitidis ATCC 18188]
MPVIQTIVAFDMKTVRNAQTSEKLNIRVHTPENNEDIERELICSDQLSSQIHDIHIALITWILQVPGDSSLIDNEIAEMHRGRLCRQREDGHRLTELQETLATSEALQELSARVCKKLLMRRLTAKEGTALLEARSWPGGGRGLAAGPKIGCSGRAERDGGTVVGGGAPASPASKKQPEES